MIHEYLKKHATFLDEGGFKVELRGAAASANESFYDGDYYSTPSFESFWQQWFRLKMRAAGVVPRPSDRVLDACCGQGHVGRFIAHEFGASVAFCDLSSNQLSFLRDRLSEEPNNPRLTVHETDICNLPFPDRAFDIVVGHSFLHHLPDVSAALTEMRRVLKKGGTAAFLHEPGLGAAFWESFPLSLIKDTSPTSGFTDLWQFSPSDLRRLALEAGYADVRVIPSGLVSSMATNWYGIALHKLGVNRSAALKPLLETRLALAALGLRARPKLFENQAPSLMLVAKG
jgi:ubiquinone/menaquinone biosynthesis C-methylase UbiE